MKRFIDCLKNKSCCWLLKVLAILCMLAVAVHYIRFDPADLVLLVLISVTYVYGLRRGLVCMAIATAYMVYVYTSPLRYTLDGKADLILFMISAPLTTLTVGLLKRKYDALAAQERMKAVAEERYKSALELEFQNVLLKTEQETSLDGILIVDDAARILSCNKRFQEIFEIPKNVVEARDDAPVLKHVVAKIVDPEAFLKRVEYLYAHRSENSREEIRLKNGRIIDRYSSPMTTGAGRYIGRVWYFRDITEKRSMESQQELLISELKEALSSVKTLNGMLPICASCKKIRDDQGYWNQIEGYISGHSQAVFSHGVCPDCMKTIYPDYVDNGINGKTRVSLDERRFEVLEAILEACPAPIIAIDLETIVKIWNPAAEKLFGWKKEEIIGKPYSLVPLDKMAEFSENLHRAKAMTPVGRFVSKRKCKDGTLVEVAISMAPVRGHGGELIGFIAIQDDIREQKRLNDDESKYLHMLEQSPNFILITDPDGKIEYANTKLLKKTGYTLDELVGKNPNIFKSGKTSAPEYVAMWKALKSGREWRCVFENKTKEGESYWVRAAIAPVKNKENVTTHYFAIQEDISEQLKKDEQFNEMAAAFEQSGSMISVSSVGGKIEYVNNAFLKRTGFKPEEVAGKTYLELGYVSQTTFEEIAATVSTGREWRGEIEHDINSNRFWTQAVITPYKDRNGNQGRTIGVEEDITDKKSLETQFRQAQKMEGIGQLAGGIAHDFNNLLTAIMGYTTLIMGDCAADDPKRRDLEEIKNTTQRAANLTRQLLTFSRKQIVLPEIIRLDALVMNMDKMLRRLLGESVELVILVPKDLKSVRLDPGQMEQVIVNLAVNSRDAMPQGGKFILEVSEASLDENAVRGHAEIVPGDFIQVSVTDTGKGMPESVKAHLFEPFFTTKEKGKGTGLGLATSYGIIKQSGGHITCDSEPGRGTTFKIYFPVVAGKPMSTVSPSSSAMPRGSETVLIAEDEISVLSMAKRILTDLGYHVLVATTGEEALRIVEKSASNGKIDLLFLDLVMPRMGGKELADELRRRSMKQTILYTSGYADASVREAISGADGAFLNKPYSPQSLAQKIRRVLDARK